MDATSLTLSVLFGAIGMGLFANGKKQGQLLHVGCGVVLMVLPYVIPDAFAMGAAGAITTLAPFLIARWV